MERNVSLPSDFRYLPALLDPAAQRALLDDIGRIAEAAPFYTPTMPRTGKPLSVRMTNCGPLGWTTDKEHGYRYQPHHPGTGDAWPPIPPCLLALWRELAPASALPEACLVNLYAPGTRLGSHQDRDEEDLDAPVISVSLGADAVFHVGGTRRSDAKTRMTLHSGDVVVLAGNARLAYHGIDRILPGTSSLVAGGGRINLTLRRVTRSPVAAGCGPAGREA
ncbi:MAG: alpha-ketoglutarate-dependent dioxygenase AlkB [Hyphomicrobiaceae bacterium]